MMWKCFFIRGQLKKVKNEEKKSNQRHVSEFAELDGGGGYSGKKKLYEDANQTENFRRTKTRNDIYYRDENNYLKIRCHI